MSILRGQVGVWEEGWVQVSNYNVCMSRRWWDGGSAPTVPFYGSIFCVLLWYYTIFCVSPNLNSPIHTYSVLFTVFFYFSSVIVSVGDPTMRSEFFIWI